MGIRIGPLGLASVLGAIALPAQPAPLPARAPTDTAAYVPRAELPQGRQLLVVYIGQTGCGASRDPELQATVRRMKPLLARRLAPCS
jgi:hypothetical protein